MIPFPQPKPARNFDGSGDRDGVCWSEREINAFVLAGGAAEVMLYPPSNAAMKREGDYRMSDMAKAYEDSNEVISTAHKAYTKTLEQFRSTIKNDVSSIASSASKMQSEQAKIAEACRATIGVLTSAEMQQAIANAERLAGALRAISELKSHNITFAVLDSKPKA